MTAKEVSIAVIDDGPAVRKALTRLLRAEGYAVKAYESAEEFWDCGLREGPDCMILDVNLRALQGWRGAERLA